MSSPYKSPEELSAPFKAEFASYLVYEKVHALYNAADTDLKKEIDRLKPKAEEKVDKSKLKIGIVGAGCAGLYTALLLDYLKIDFDILEASDRAGGRVKTYTFKQEPACAHNYYDIGAMRFPKTPIMDRTFDLFHRTGVNEKLIPYYMEGKNQPTRFNDITAILPLRKDPPLPVDKSDPFEVSTPNGGPVPLEVVQDPQIIMDRAYDRFRNEIKHPRKGPYQTAWQARHAAWKYLMKHDKWSLRGYLNFVEGEDSQTIDWLETQNSATGWFDQAFTENVMESLAFEWFDKHEEPSPDPKPIPGKDGKPLKNGDWYCIEGGTEELTKVLEKRFREKIKYETPVSKMVLKNFFVEKQETIVEVTTDKVVTDDSKSLEHDTLKYSAIVNTTTLGALQKIDLTEMQLPYTIKAAIRSLHYDTSTKVGIKFKYPWWIKNKGIVQAGLGKTDMPLRVCVYPSYNLDDGKDKPAVLLASYTWGQDSERVAAYINDKPPKEQVELKELMIYNLARLHSKDEAEFIEIRDIIRASWIEHYAWDWSKDPHSAGAFALFSPANFTEHYPSLVNPSCDSRLYIVGEAASAHHAWIVGALDSAMRGVCQMLHRFGLNDEWKKLEEKFGPAGEMDYDMDDVAKTDTLDLQIALGRLEKAKLPNLPLMPPVIAS